MRPPPIYPQLSHFHNHGLAIPFHCIWKEIFEEYFSSRLSSKSSSPQRDRALKRERERKGIENKRKEKRRDPRVSANKKGKSIFWEEKNILTSKSFYVSPFFPLHHTISETLSKIIWENFTAHFGPSFNLAIYMTWVLSFVFTH
jgi:hypothetical protein